MYGRAEALKNVGAVVAGLVAIVGAAVVAGVGPFAATSDTATATSDQLLNRAQVARITESPHMADVALPLDLPPHLDYLQAIRTESWGSEVTFQEGGQHVIVCGGSDVDAGTGSGCKAGSATVFRDELTDGRRVRVAWVTWWDGTTKTPPEASPEHTQVEAFWKNVDLQLGVPSWLRTFD